MQRVLRSLPPFAVVILIASCDGISAPDENVPITSLPRELSVAEGKLIEADNRFAFKLFRAINDEAGDSNLFISPLSVGMALGMTYNGAAGTTQEAMQQTLELQGMTIAEVNQSYRDLIDLLTGLDSRVEFTIANSIWYRPEWAFEQAFLDVNREFFDAEVVGLDFDAPTAGRQVNQWVADKTKGKIDKIVADGPLSDLIMLLINAIYFKADWTSQFDKSLTEDGPFTLKDGSRTTAKMMWHKDPVSVWLYRGDGVTVVDLPYGGQAFSMTILVPDSPQGIDALVGGLTQEQWSSWIAGLDSTGLVVSMPKFKLEYEIKLNDVLQGLGMAVAFAPGEADFTRMYVPGGIWIDWVLHKTFVDVNEEGTEAAAVTAVAMTVSAGPPSLIIDRPFVFVIREKFSGTILFMGKVMDPTAG